MNTLDQQPSTLKPQFTQNPDKLRLEFERAFEDLVALRQQLEYGLIDFAQFESQAVELHRGLSCESHAFGLSALEVKLPPTLLEQGERFEPERQVIKTYTCLDGPVRLKVWRYKSTSSSRTLIPVEARAGLIQGQYTAMAMRVLLMSHADQDYRSAQKLREAAHLLGRSKSAAQRDINAVSDKLHGLDESLEAARRDTLEHHPQAKSLTVSVDRTGLPFEEPRQRKRGRPKAGAPQKPCEVVHRQVYCACVCLVDDQGQVLSTQRFGALPGQDVELVQRVSACVERWLELHEKLDLITLCDGAAEMRRLAREILGGRQPKAELVDAWHAMEYVHQAVKAAGKPVSWSKVLTKRLLENKRGATELLTRMRTWRMEKASEVLDQCITFFENQHERMQYAAAREKGWMIGSGNVEATCKTVVAVRFKRSGARWKSKGAQPLLKVRALMASDGPVWELAFEAFADTYVKRLAS